MAARVVCVWWSRLAALQVQADLVGKTVALYNPSNNRWLRVTDDGQANSPSTGAAFQYQWGWERFEVRDVGDGHVALYNAVTQRWLRVLGDGHVDANCKDPTFNSNWQSERFHVRDAGEDHVALYCEPSNRWVCLTPKGSVAGRGFVKTPHR